MTNEKINTFSLEVHKNDKVTEKSIIIIKNTIKTLKIFRFFTILYI